MKPSPLRPIGKAIVRIPQTYPHVYIAREPITEPIIHLDTESARPIPVKAVKKFVKRVPAPAVVPVVDLLRLLLAPPAPAVVPAPKKMMKKIGRAVEPVVDFIRAEQAQGQIGEAVPIERGNRFMDMFQMAGGIPTSQYLNLSELPGLATSTPELATTIRALPEGLVKPSTQIADLLPPLLKQLKVGDVVYQTRRVDTDDNTRSAYNTTTKAVVKSIAKDHTSFMILPYKRNGKEFEKSAKRVTLVSRSWKGVTLTDDWSIDDSRYHGLYRTIEERDRYDPPLKEALQQEAIQKKQQEYEAEASKLNRVLNASPEEKEAQYATLPKRQLLDLYQVWSNRTGRRITNIKTAPVKKILEVFKQFNI